MQSELLAHINGIFSGKTRRKSEIPDNGVLDSPDKTSGIRFRRKSDVHQPVTTSGMKLSRSDYDSKSNRLSLVQVAKLNLKRLSIGEDTPPKLPARHFSTDSDEEFPPPIPERICSLELVVDAEFQGRFAFRPISTVPLPEVFSGGKKTYPSKAPKKKGLQRPPSQPPPPPPPPLETSSPSPTSTSPTSQPVFFLGAPPPPAKLKPPSQVDLGEFEEEMPREIKKNVYNGTLEPVPGGEINGKFESVPHNKSSNGVFQYAKKTQPDDKISAGNSLLDGSNVKEHNSPTPTENATIIVGKPKIPQKPQKLGALEGFEGNFHNLEEDLSSKIQSSRSCSSSLPADSKPSLARLTSFTADSEAAILPFIEKTPVLSAGSIRRYVERSVNPASQAPQVPVQAQSTVHGSAKSDIGAPNSDINSVRTKSGLTSAGERKETSSTTQEKFPPEERPNQLSALPPPLPPRPALPSLGKTQGPTTVKSGVGVSRPSLALPAKPVNTNDVRSPVKSGAGDSKDFYFGYDTRITPTSLPLPPPPPPPPSSLPSLHSPETSNPSRVPSPPLPPPPPSLINSAAPSPLPPASLELIQQSNCSGSQLPSPPPPPPPAQDKPLPPPPPAHAVPVQEAPHVTGLTGQGLSPSELQPSPPSWSRPYSLLSLSTSTGSAHSTYAHHLPVSSPAAISPPLSPRNNGWGGQEVFDPREEEGDPYDTVDIYKF